MSDCSWKSEKINDENPAVRCVVTEGELEIVLEIHRDGSPWSGSNEDKYYVSPPTQCPRAKCFF